MFKVLCVSTVFLFSNILWAGENLTLERIYAAPDINGFSPKNMGFSPDGKRLSFLQGKKENFEVLDLWEYDLSTGKPRLLVDSKTFPKVELSEEEKARRERQGNTAFEGILDYKWSDDGRMILFPASNELFLYVFGKKTEQITKNSGAEIDVKFSPKSSYISYVRDQNLYLYDINSKKEQAVTTEGKEDISYGTAEFIAQEEMGRMTGYWWSKDEQWLAFTKVDETQVTTVDRYEIAADKVTVRKQKYPETGGTNAKIKLGIARAVDVLNGKKDIHWLELPRIDFYLTRADWTPDGLLAYQIQSRNQKKLTVYLYDPATRKTKTLFTETDKYWINLHNDWHWLKNRDLVFASERSGYRHIYLMDRQGKIQRALTRGHWTVDKVEGIDEDGGWVYFTGALKSSLEKHFYRTRLDRASEPEPLTTGEGFNEIKMAENKQYYMRFFSNPTTPEQVSLHKISGEKIADLNNNAVVKGHPLFPYLSGFSEEEYGTFKNKSGTLLHYRLIKPKNFDPQKKYPMIVSSYGGPIFQWVKKSWRGSGSLLPQVWAQRGFVVASFENRGSSRRGQEFEVALNRAFGTVEVEDQVAGVQHILSKGFVDKQRVGFFGWSYGGFLSLMLATKSPDTFRAAIAGAPVTDFSLYDTHYTERYMGTPQANPQAYHKANALNFIDGLKTRMLIIHGMADDNVQFTNSTMLFKKLQDKGKVYESVTYPGGKHGVSGKTSQLHVQKTTLDFFERYLSP